MSRVLEISKYTTWGLTGISIFSTICRNDYNIIFSVFLLIVLNNFYNQNPKLISKIIIHLLSLLSIADIIWLIFMSGGWSHNTKDSNQLYWDSLKVMHSIIYVLAVIELILKILLVYYLFVDYKGKYPWKELIKFDYTSEKINTFANGETGNNFFNNQREFTDEFKNDY